MDTTPRRRPLAVLLALVMATVLAGCSFETPETDRATEQARQVLADTGVPVITVWLSADSATKQVTAEVSYDPSGAPDGLEATSEAVAGALWRRSIAQIDAIDVDAGPNTASRYLSGRQLTERFGARPDGLVQVDGATIAKENDDLMRGLVGIILAASVLPLLLFGLGFLVVVAAVVIIVVVVTRRRPPPPPAPPGWPGYPYQA